MQRGAFDGALGFSEHLRNEVMEKKGKLIVLLFSSHLQGAAGSLNNITPRPDEADEEKSSQRWQQRKQRIAKNIFGASYIPFRPTLPSFTSTHNF